MVLQCSREETGSSPAGTESDWYRVSKGTENLGETDKSRTDQIVAIPA